MLSEKPNRSQLGKSSGMKVDLKLVLIVGMRWREMFCTPCWSRYCLKILVTVVSFDMHFMLVSVKYYRGDFGYILLASSEQPQSCQSVQGNLHVYYNIKKTEYIGFCAIKQTNQGK
ncbi:unnamed protein product [Larinioides sclopetarius]|uniref:Uncharacterized protein n=1 Tax=Larinioides sclopetarius TaxID=280406 RepID=A0AAV2AI64_9ARAC